MLTMHDLIDPRTADFLGLNATLETIRPSSEAARRKLSNLDAFGPDDRDELAAHHLRMKRMMTILMRTPEVADRLRHHLRHLPWLGDVWEQQWGQAELALLVTFRFHHHRLRDLLENQPEIGPWCDLAHAADLDGMMFGDAAASRFALDERRDEELARVRGVLRQLSADARSIEEALREQIADDFDLSADATQWVIDRADRDLLESMSDDNRLVISAEAISSVCFAPRPSKQLIAIRRDLDLALADERAIETRIYREIEDVVRSRQLAWQRAERQLVKLDFLITQAQRALDTGAVAPEFAHKDDGVTVDIRDGSHLGVRRWVEDHASAYTPLTVEISESVATLSGANMGGKTVVLQTFGWLQAMAQLGFFVPARVFVTRLYRRIAALSTYHEAVGGLSGFGREIERLREILPWRAKPTLYLIDEPGRTTHVEEGRALTRAVLETILQSPSVALVSTHLDGLDTPGIGMLRMGGLRHDLLKDWRKADKVDLPLLHRLMQYTVHRADPDATRGSDALDVAELLGLEAPIIARARELLEPET